MEGIVLRKRSQTERQILCDLIYMRDIIYKKMVSYRNRRWRGEWWAQGQ